MGKVKVTVLGAWGTSTIGETSSFLVESENFNILLDMCPGVTRQMKRLNFEMKNLNMAFGSHVHSDHLLGATYLLFQHSVEIRGLVDSGTYPFTFLGTNDVLTTIESVIQLHYPDRGFEYKKNVINEKSVLEFQNEGIKILFAKNNHTVDTMGIRLEFRDGPSICYTADGLFTEDIYKLAEGADLLIGEAFGAMDIYQDKYQNVKHSLGIHLGELAKICDVKMVLPFHMNPLYNSYEKKNILLDEIRKNYNGKIIWPGDLQIIEL